MELDMNPTDGDDSLGINDTLDHVGNAVESIVDFIVPDGMFAWGLDAVPGAAGADAGVDPIKALMDGQVPPAMMNDGFYQSLPGVDAGTGILLDQTAELCAEIEDFGRETVGDEAWQQAGVVAAIDPDGRLDDIPTAGDLELKWAQQDSESAREFADWQTEQDAQREIDHSAKVIQEGQDLL